ncbi:NAD-dependent epimerase/dehydratase family protein [Vannielia litorea]|uniref:UDP-glucuronate decarboxylase n=1 Tax=Vannielia litorea TaxID=1217970 RepID=A0A1N6DZL7_9RHOB|nr:NAD-dependent epimerase/dehydratase family protein [Vannielia litorea]SIN76164.1 UDP-glucuronate decarboxylase [Vannielia litorea]
MKHVLVTGGAGFIGRHLVKALLNRGARVTVLDDMSTGHRENLPSHPRLTVTEGCVTRLPDPGPVDMIYNLACRASPRHYQADPIGTWRASVHGVEQVASLARRHSARIVHSSTSEVYGDPEVTPQTEAYVGHVNPVGPRACYDESKRAAETLLADLYRIEGLQVRIARIFNTYGPGMAADDGRVVSNFVVQALKGVPLTIYGDGRQTRSFCHVRDMVAGLLALGETEGIDGAIVNIGNPGEFTIAALAAKIAALAGVPLEIAPAPLPADDPRQRRPDITRARALLGWEPKVELDEGLADTMAHFRELLALT